MGWAAGHDPARGPADAGGAAEPRGQSDHPPELARLRSLWGGIYEITCPDGTWCAFHCGTGEEVASGSLPALRSAIRRDYERRLETRPGAPERMST
jgi:hypothetical protein